MTILKTKVGIVGAGPGGLQLSASLAEAGIDYLTFERGEAPGNFFTTMPRKRRLISLNKVHVGDVQAETRLRWDWNSLVSNRMPRFTEYDQEYHPNADSLVRYLRDFADTHDLNVVSNCNIEKVEKLDLGFRLTAEGGRMFDCEAVVIATGLFRACVPEIEGIELAWQYGEIPDDPKDFIDKRVLIIGKGNSAFESADWLLPFARCIHMVSPEPDRMAAMTHFVGDTRSVNYSFYDTAFFKQQNAMLNGTINSIRQVDGMLEVELTYAENDEPAVIRYHHVICCTGFEFDDGIFAPNCRPNVEGATRLPLLKSNWESRNIKDLYFSGTLMQGNDFRRSSTPFIKGIRHNSCALANILSERIVGADWPCDLIQPEALHDQIMDRVNCASSLWHLWNSLCDVYLIDKSAGSVRHLRDVPQSMVFDDGRFSGTDFITLRFGHHFPDGMISEACGEDPFIFIHPIFNLVGSDGNMIDEAHFNEVLEAEWAEPDISTASLRDLLNHAFANVGWAIGRQQVTA